MNNLCWCGHPKERHGFGTKTSELTGNELIDVEGGNKCKHCACIEYESKEPKALEECDCPKYAFYKGKWRLIYHCEHEAKPQDEPKE